MLLWESDMYFRIGSKTHEYRDLDTKIPKSVIKNIPKDVEFVYWDYGRNTDYDFYTKFIDLHRKIGKDPIVATSSWNWNRFWSALPFAYSAIEPCIQACKDKNIRQVFITTWGDDGMENDIYSTLPAIQFLAELSYNDSIDKKLLEANFKGICKADLNAYNLASGLDTPSSMKKQNITNISKWLLWDDPFIGLCEPFQEGKSFRKYYITLGKRLEEAVNKDSITKRLRFPEQIALVLSIKCDCRKNLVSAYRVGNRKNLAKLLKFKNTTDELCHMGSYRRVATPSAIF